LTPQLQWLINNETANWKYSKGGKPMNEKDGINMRGREHLTPDERHRLTRANQICEQVSHEVGFDLDTVEQVAACVDFVHGHIDEPELWERARVEMEERLTA
jgi:hypothetical protein